jgi:hypothetical protein
MTPRERFLTVLNGGMPDDRLPMVEWAAWWNMTTDRWKQEGMPSELTWEESIQYFGLDELRCLHAAPKVPEAPYHGAPVIKNEGDYDRLRESIFSDQIIDNLIASAKKNHARHEAGEVSVRIMLDGFFWFPRRLFGIEPHLYAFYENPELMHRMNRDLCTFNLRVVEALFPVMKPEFIGVAEDMSYNHGPMISQKMFDEFIRPHYQKLTAYNRRHNVRTLVDSDGDVTMMVPWFQEAGIEGVYPLERQAHVDIGYLRQEYPEFIMMGGYNKMIMHKGEAAIRAEFERILPVMRSSRYIPSVDHQTPPGVSLDDYRIYIRLFREYCEKALKG